MFEAGFVREGGEAYSPTAIRWWVVAVDDDGFRFARGGRTHSAQDAKGEISSAYYALDRERAAWTTRATHELVGDSLVRRFTHELLADGSLRPLEPHDFEVE